MPAARPTRGPAVTAASISSRLTAPTCTAMARPATKPASSAALGSMASVLAVRAARCKILSPKTAILAVMDATDSEILRVLREDGRISWSELGAAVGLSANAAAERVRRMRRDGVIIGFTAIVDPAELDALLRTLRLRLGAADTETTIVLRSGPA